MATVYLDDIVVSTLPIIIIGTVYFLVAFFKRGSLSRPVHMAFRFTLVIFIVWGVYALTEVINSTDHFLLMRGFFLIIFFLPVSFGSFIIVWSVVTLFEYWTQPAYVKVEVTARGKTIAVIFLVLAMIIFLGYLQLSK